MAYLLKNRGSTALRSLGTTDLEEFVPKHDGKVVTAGPDTILQLRC